MTRKIEELLEALPQPGSIEDLGFLIDTIRNVFEVNNVAYVAFSLGGPYALASVENGMGLLKKDAGSWWRQDGALGAVTYSPEWGARYAESDYQRIDPVVEGALKSFVPLDWKTLDWSTPQRKKFQREAIECGLGNQGYTIPIRGPDGQFAIFLVNNHCSDEAWERFLAEHKGALLIVSHFFHQKVLDVEKVFGEPTAPKLSMREVDALRYLAVGKSRSQTAHSLNISENTLRVYIDSARHKLGALNVTHAIAIGVNKGILNI
jgi:DNA-binding CsgD family transcriptional regulator